LVVERRALEPTKGGKPNKSASGQREMLMVQQDVAVTVILPT
jgi:hypothetical protein